MLLHPEVGEIADIAGEDLGLAERGRLTGLVGEAEEELAGLEGRARAGRGLDAGALDHGLRQSVAVAEMLVRVLERWGRLQVQARDHLDTRLGDEALVLFPATLALGDVLRE